MDTKAEITLARTWLPNAEVNVINTSESNALLHAKNGYLAALRVVEAVGELQGFIPKDLFLAYSAWKKL